MGDVDSYMEEAEVDSGDDLPEGMTPEQWVTSLSPRPGVATHPAFGVPVDAPWLNDSQLVRVESVARENAEQAQVLATAMHVGTRYGLHVDAHFH